MEPYAGVIEKYRPLINAPTGMQAVTLLEKYSPYPYAQYCRISSAEILLFG